MEQKIPKDMLQSISYFIIITYPIHKLNNLFGLFYCVCCIPVSFKNARSIEHLMILVLGG